MRRLQGAVDDHRRDRGPRPRSPPTPGSPRTTATRCASSAPWRPRSAWSTGRTGTSSRCPGEERASWLHTLTTQHLTDLRAGQASELLVLSPHGHVEQHAYVTEDGTTAWLDTEPGAGAGLLKYLEMMRFFTRVEPRDASAEMAVLSLVGPDAVAAADARRHRSGRAAGRARCRARSSPPGRCRPARQRCTRYAQFERRSGPPGAARRRPARAARRRGRGDRDRWPTCRWPGCGRTRRSGSAHRIPRLGWETDHRTIPAEAGFIAPRRAPGQGLLPRSGDRRPGAPPRPAAAPPGPAAPGRRRHRPAAGAGHAGDAGRARRSASSAPRSATTSWA